MRLDPSFRRAACRIPLFLAALSLTGASLFAQSTATGTVSGLITDAQGAVIPAAELKLIDKGTAVAKTAVANENGRYNFFNINPGLYDLVISKPGFSQAKFTDQKVEVGLVLTLDATLQVGAAATILEVTAQAGAELQTTNATVGSTISGTQLDSLPNIGRDANAFILLQPGVAPSSTVTGGGQVAGAIGDQNSFQLDGGNNSSDMDGNQAVYTLASGTITGSAGGTPSGVVPTPIESIEEFKVSTSNQTADFNGSAGGQVQMVTKRGTNQFHGAAYEYLLSSYFSANLWKNNHTPSNGQGFTPLPKTHQNRYGASLGGPLLPRMLGGKTYFFFNYEARRFPQSASIERTVPTDTLKAGVIQLPNSSGVLTAYNLNPYPVTVNGTSYPPAVCPAGACDPRGLGLNPLVSKVWNLMPRPNDPQAGDTYNTQGYLTSIAIPQNSDNYTARIDHDFGQNWRLMTSYRYYKFAQNTSNQVDIGGLLGGSVGQAVATAPRVQKPGYWVVGLSSTLRPTLTNDFHYNFLRNYWEWGTKGAPPQLAGLGGALEIGGESAGLNALVPYNVNAQSVRSRFWDGQDHMLRDDLSWVKGNHLVQFGGSYQRNFNFHQRDDNGAGIFKNAVYQIGGATGGLNFLSAYIPSNLPANQIGNWNNYFTEVLGIVSQPQTLYARAGASLTLQPPNSNVSDKVTIPYYNLYIGDTWKAKKNLTLSYGIGYQLEMPPTEAAGKQILLVDQDGKQIVASDYLAARKAAALQGQVYNPNLGFVTINNAPSKPSYLYDPFYGGFSPRIAAAWNPQFSSGFLGRLFGNNETVIRGGYGRIYGRLNGVSQVLNPLLGAGIMQPVSCIGASKSGQCLGSGGVDATTAFRIGADGLSAPLPSVSQTLAQPFYPGQFGNAAAGDATVLDKHYKPNQSDVYDFTIQRQLSSKMTIEVGYIGRVIRNEFQLINLDAVPTMTTLGGQSYAQAFASIYTQISSGQTITPQPFFEAVMGGPGSGYCSGYSSCTAAVAAKQKSQITATQAYSLWTNLSKGAGWILGRTLPDSAPAQTASIYETTSLGRGNYNGVFASFTMKDFHGLTARSNFTWSRALGTVGLTQSTSSTTVLDLWDFDSMYGPQPFDIRFVYNLAMVYSPKIFRGNTWKDKLLGGWNFSPLFTAQSGAPLRVSVGSGTSNCQSFGESNCSSVSTYENAVLAAPFTGGNSLHSNVTSSTNVASTGNPSKGGSGLNIFGDPNAIYAEFRRLILGIDHRGNAAGPIRGFPTWNLDMAVSKDFKYNERIGMTFNAQFSNMLNHFQASDPTLNIDSPTTFGVVTGQANTPRQIEFGLRVRF